MEPQQPREIQVCMGKSCQLKGSPLIAQALRVELEKRKKYQESFHICEVTSAYCQTQCTEGVVVRIGSETFTRVTVADVPYLINRLLSND